MPGIVIQDQGTPWLWAESTTPLLCPLDTLGIVDPCFQVHAGQVLLELPVPLHTLSLQSLVVQYGTTHITR